MRLGALGQRILDELAHFGVCARSGLIGLEPPQRITAIVRAVYRFGTIGAFPSIAAVRYPDRAAVIDDRGQLTFADLEAHSNALANAWRVQGLRPGECMAILARNHRGFLEATFAAAKCGARIVLLNTDFAAPQLREVIQREGVHLLVHDDEYTGMLTEVEPSRGRFRAWTDAPGTDTLDALIATNPATMPPKPGTTPKIILLTSGITGAPKGVSRLEPRSLSVVGGVLGKVPFRAREAIECCAPLFHMHGFANMLLAVALGSTLLLHRRFDPETVLTSLQEHRVNALIAVPIMLRRILELDQNAFAVKDLSTLKIIFVAGSQLGSELCRRATAMFGPVVYNLYGSTEVAYATVATPSDLSVEPGCVGQVLRGTQVKIFDNHGAEVPDGQHGRIFVGNSVRFQGYTGVGTKEIIGGLISTGDIGHFDAARRLFIDGRDDDMIISGGENVFPGEIEELLAGHHAVHEVSAIGVADEKFGQRLRVFVVPREGTTLTEEEVKDCVRANLARYKTPRDVVFLTELPRNAAGKVLKRELIKYPVNESTV